VTGQDLIEAIEQSRFEAFGSFGRPPHGETQSDPELVCVFTTIPVLSPVCSCIFRARFALDETERRIDWALSQFAERSLPVIWNTGPSTRPRELPQYLVAQGLTPILEPAGMAANLHTLNTQPSAPAELEIRLVSDADTLKHWAEVFAGGFGVAGNIQEPLCTLFASLLFGLDAPWHLFLGVLHGVPVATSALYLGADVAGIYFVTTLPQARHQGIGSAVTHASLLTARAQGYDSAVLHASPMARHMYTQLGFQTYCSMGLFAWTPDAQHSAP